MLCCIATRNSQLATNNKQLRNDGNSSSANTSTGCTPSTHPVLRTTITSSLISSLMCAVVVSSDDTLASTNKSDREMTTFTTSRHNCHSQGSFTAFPRQIASCCLIPCKESYRGEEWQLSPRLWIPQPLSERIAVVASILFRTKSIGAVWLKTVMTVQLIKGCRTIFDLR